MSNAPGIHEHRQRRHRAWRSVPEPTSNVPPRRRTGPVLWGLRVLARRAGAGLGGFPCRPATGTYLQWHRCDGIGASRKVRALWALSQREMTSGAPAAGAGEREDLTSPTGLIGGQWLGRSRPCPITWLRPPGARACSLLRTFTVYLHRLLLLPRTACRFATFEGQRGRRRRGRPSSLRL